MLLSPDIFESFRQNPDIHGRIDIQAKKNPRQARVSLNRCSART